MAACGAAPTSSRRSRSAPISSSSAARRSTASPPPGEPGVRRALQILKSETERVMALLGCSSVEELGPQFLRSAYSARIFAPRAMSVKTRISSASS
jgi:hypothetical protein